MAAPLVVWRIRTTFGFTWFGTPAPSSWQWRCRRCDTAGPGYPSHDAALDAALGHLAVWHAPSPVAR